MNLRNAELQNVNNPPFVPDTCPQNCTLIGYVPYRNHIIKLQIQKNAKRADSTSNLCFAEKAKVTGILSMKGNPAKITSIDRPSLCGQVSIGKFLTYSTPIPPSFKPAPGYGVPFYLTPEEAIAGEWRAPLPPA